MRIISSPVFLSFLPLIASNLLFDLLLKAGYKSITSLREIYEFNPLMFALRSEEGDEYYLPDESELSCSCSSLLLSSLGQAAGVQPQSMGIYER